MENDLIYNRKIWDYVKESIDAYDFHLKHVKMNNLIIIKHNKKKLNSIEHADELIDSETSKNALIEYDGIDFYYSIYNILPSNVSIDRLMNYYDNDVTSFKNCIKDNYIIITKNHIGKLSDYLVDNLTEDYNSSSNVYSHILKRFTTVE